MKINQFDFLVLFYVVRQKPNQKNRKTNTDKNRSQNKVSLKSLACGQAKNSNPQINLEHAISK